jgi:hypothetical protein
VENEDIGGETLSDMQAPLPVGVSATRFARVRPVSTSQRYRLRNPSSGREIVIEAEPQEIYLDRDTGEPMEIVGKLLPLAPSASLLPWAVENMRFCSWCDQLAQKDLNDCPTCSRRMGPLTPRPAS